LGAAGRTLFKGSPADRLPRRRLRPWGPGLGHALCRWFPSAVFAVLEISRRFQTVSPPFCWALTMRKGLMTDMSATRNLLAWFGAGSRAA